MSLSLLVVAYFATWISLFFALARGFFWLLDLLDRRPAGHAPGAGRTSPNLGRLYRTHACKTALYTHKGGVQ